MKWWWLINISTDSCTNAIIDWCEMVSKAVLTKAATMKAEKVKGKKKKLAETKKAAWDN